jgi:hypothetical protein
VCETVCSSCSILKNLVEESKTLKSREVTFLYKQGVRETRVKLSAQKGRPFHVFRLLVLLSSEQDICYVCISAFSFHTKSGCLTAMQHIFLWQKLGFSYLCVRYVNSILHIFVWNVFNVTGIEIIRINKMVKLMWLYLFIALFKCALYIQQDMGGHFIQDPRQNGNFVRFQKSSHFRE